ncbi:MAG: archaetidylserine decarboxylase [Candidatus Symbiodolus clandestinus]
MFNRFKIILQYLLPKYLLSLLGGWLANRRAGILTRGLIRLFIRYYNIDLQEAALSQVSDYNTFNQFFTRYLHADARPITCDDQWLVLPVDGFVSQLGDITESGLLQAKGHYYSLEQLLAGDHSLTKLFQGGKFATLYLSPRDYHRVHMPCEAVLQKMIYVPGSRFSVSSLTAQHVPQLFARNERVITFFDTQFGPMVQILVGAMVVGSIQVVWAGQVCSWAGNITQWDYSGEKNSPINLPRGSEMGHFSLGSTVINLFANPQLSFEEMLIPGQAIKLGNKYAKCL